MGGTNPRATCEEIAEEAPDIYQSFEKSHILTLCENLHRAEIPEESERFQQMFRDFNIDYFGGKLQEYEVRVVYDPALAWRSFG